VPQETPYRYVNVAGAWPGARIDGLVSDDEGRLGLPPGPAGVTPYATVSIDPADGLVGLACAPDGTIYVADPGGGRVLRVDPCDRSVRILGCLDRATDDPAAPRGPRGLALGPRHTLVVADPPTGRVLIVDRGTGAIRDVWTDGFVEPWAVAVDGEDRVLVADAGAASVRRFGADGEEDLRFAPATGGPGLGLGSPRGLALLPGGAILVVDQSPSARILGLDGEGRPDARLTATFGGLDAGSTLALVQVGSTTWAAGRAGLAAVTDGLVARQDEPVAVGVDVHCDGSVLVATATAILVLAPGGASTYGTLVVPAPAGLEPWDRVRVILAEPLPPATHLRVWTSAGPAVPIPSPPSAGDDPEAPFPTPVGTWRAAPLDELDVRPLLAPAAALWIAVEWHGDGTASPRVEDVRVDRMGRGWADDLPHVLVAEPADPLIRFLALLASVYGEVAGGIDALPERLDPAITPDRPDAPWLARLARWVDVEPAARLDEAGRRALVGDALAAHERRGTVRGLVDAVARDLGIEVSISEPAPAPAWPLGRTGGGLAFASPLVAAPPGEPVLDTTAIVDRSWLIDPDERGLPLLGGSAHRFCVHVPPDVLRDPTLRAEVERVLEREKPAHTVFELDAGLAAGGVVGTTRVGVDRLTDGTADALDFDGADRLGSGTVLRGRQPTDPPAPGRVGQTIVIGVPDPERTR
jgi:phage tail-like protein